MLTGNWFAVHLGQIRKVLPRLRSQFLSPASPFIANGEAGAPALYDTVEDAEGTTVRFTPDGVFSITDDEQEKTLLFFLEADMGTEPLIAAPGTDGDVRTKIANYQAYFRQQKYKRYERTWDCKLNGFRLLFLANTETRVIPLCRLLREMPPTDFVWVTSQDRMLSNGLADTIWVRGGHTDRPAESILGKTTARRSALPPVKG